MASYGELCDLHLPYHFLRATRSAVTNLFGHSRRASDTDLGMGTLSSSNLFSTGPVHRVFQPGILVEKDQISEQRVPQLVWMVRAGHCGVGLAVTTWRLPVRRCTTGLTPLGS